MTACLKRVLTAVGKKTIPMIMLHSSNHADTKWAPIQTIFANFINKGP